MAIINLFMINKNIYKRKKINFTLSTMIFCLIGLMGCSSGYKSDNGEGRIQAESNYSSESVEIIENSDSSESINIIEHTPKDLQNELKELPLLISEEDLAPTIINDVVKGDVIEFGTYEQNANTSDGTEPIQWEVLEVKDGQAYLISVCALDCKKYNDNKSNTTWEKCTLRSWLNGEFYKQAFSDSDKQVIVLSHLINENNPESGISGGNETDDYVYLLSYSDSVKYFNANIKASASNPYNSSMACVPTKYAEKKGAEVYEDRAFLPNGHNTTCSWWLRTVGKGQDDAVDFYMSWLSTSGTDVNSDKHGVRPVICINLNGVVTDNLTTDTVVSVSKINALKMAEAYLNVMPFSQNGLIEQLEYEGFSYEDAKYATDNCSADWSEQAILMGKRYLEIYEFSRMELVEQLKYEGFSSYDAGNAATELGF